MSTEDEKLLKEAKKLPILVSVISDAMEKAIKAKVAKAVVPAIRDVMFQALSEFGSMIVPPKRILKMLPELFDHQDQNVCASSKGVTLELCRWIGKDPVKSILFEKMRDTMKKELEAELPNVTGFSKPFQEVKIVFAFVGFKVHTQDGSHNDLRKSKSLNQKLCQRLQGLVQLNKLLQIEIVEYVLVDPVDILTPLEKIGFWAGVKATKWSERKEAVAELSKLASTK
ncbi:hypothetical protein POM88_047479 [Heracleum sosnowskyi]|uniref:XMAP215/Dis1/CLASP TOG domain-containing protein n=1 Tax=Heracleum sosnowskyi TaxID=360622 RepID=A0AAD8GUE6_9APIA|nr:hypothetical protein POM88_047479 [Heracleum sosnowskyi]